MNKKYLEKYLGSSKKKDKIKTGNMKIVDLDEQIPNSSQSISEKKKILLWKNDSKTVKEPIIDKTTSQQDENEIIIKKRLSGLQTAADVRRNLEEKKSRELQRLNEHANSGKEAETVHRTKSGKKIDIEEERIENLRKAKEKEEIEKTMIENAKGTAQKEQNKKIRENLKEAQKMNFARTKDDHDYNKRLREEVRWDDPLRPTEKKRKACKFPGTPNRFNIEPGHQWDGVDRSNGFEYRFMREQANRIAREEQSYRWSVEDM
jgi:hypothetical protein